MESELDQIAGRALAQRESDQLLRRRRVLDAGLINFSSNDYLGLSQHPLLIEAIARGARELGAGSGASALMTGYSQAHAEAEGAIAEWKGTESAVLLPSGYQANVAAVQAIAGAAHSGGRGVRFLLDKLVHASLIDAVRSTELGYRVFGHNDLNKLERLLKEPENSEQLQVIVTESIFSMDGDAAELAGIVKLKKQYGAVLLVDEAHGSGVYGVDGSGYVAERGMTKDVDVFVVTFSKAMGCVGGAVCGSKAVGALVENFSRAYIYTTAVPAFIASAARASLKILNDEPERQRRVRELAVRVRQKLIESGMEIPGGDSPIIPIKLGTEEAAMRMSDALLERGMLVTAVRPPTVAKGSSRLRVTLSAAHGDEEVELLLRSLVEMRRPI